MQPHIARPDLLPLLQIDKLNSQFLMLEYDEAGQNYPAVADVTFRIPASIRARLLEVQHSKTARDDVLHAWYHRQLGEIHILQHFNKQFE